MSATGYVTMLNKRHIAGIVIGLAVARAAPVAAQTLPSAGTMFVDVTLGPDWDDARSASTRVPGATLRSGVAFGFDWGTSGVELDVSVAQWHVTQLETYRYQYVGPSFGWERQGAFYESFSTVRRRSIEMTVLYRFDVPLHRRVTFSGLAGGGYVFRPDQATRFTNEARPDGQRIEANVTKSTSSRNYLAAAGRLDVEFRITSRVAVVPRLRVTVFPSLLDDSGTAPRMLVARPEIAMRWQF